MIRILSMCALYVVISLATGACSTIVEGSDQSVTVITDPSGASCELARDGQTIAYVNPTPGTVVVTKSKDTIAVTCNKEERITGAGVLASEFEDMTFGNIILGGLIGLAVDASSGAINEYPPSITIVLPPRKFVSIEDRDAYFDLRFEEVDTLHQKSVDAASSSSVCTRDPESDNCLKLILKMDEQWLAETQQIEAQRSQGVVE